MPYVMVAVSASFAFYGVLVVMSWTIMPLIDFAGA